MPRRNYAIATSIQSHPGSEKDNVSDRVVGVTHLCEIGLIPASKHSYGEQLHSSVAAPLHTLRHTHGSFMLANGVDLATVSERLGHSSVRVTADIYTQALHGRDQDAARRWDAFMRVHDAWCEESDRVRGSRPSSTTYKRSRSMR